MKIRQLVVKEIFHRKVNYALSVFATLIATASLIGSIVLLHVHDARTSSILHRKGAELEVIEELEGDNAPINLPFFVFREFIDTTDG